MKIILVIACLFLAACSSTTTGSGDKVNSVVNPPIMPGGNPVMPSVIEPVDITKLLNTNSADVLFQNGSGNNQSSFFVSKSPTSNICSVYLYSGSSSTLKGTYPCTIAPRQGSQPVVNSYNGDTWIQMQSIDANTHQSSGIILRIPTSGAIETFNSQAIGNGIAFAQNLAFISDYDSNDNQSFYQLSNGSVVESSIPFCNQFSKIQLSDKFVCPVQYSDGLHYVGTDGQVHVISLPSGVTLLLPSALSRGNDVYVIGSSSDGAGLFKMTFSGSTVSLSLVSSGVSGTSTGQRILGGYPPQTIPDIIVLKGPENNYTDGRVVFYNVSTGESTPFDLFQNADAHEAPIFSGSQGYLYINIIMDKSADKVVISLRKHIYDSNSQQNAVMRLFSFDKTTKVNSLVAKQNYTPSMPGSLNFDNYSDSGVTKYAIESQDGQGNSTVIIYDATAKTYSNVLATGHLDNSMDLGQLQIIESKYIIGSLDSNYRQSNYYSLESGAFVPLYSNANIGHGSLLGIGSKIYFYGVLKDSSAIVYNVTDSESIYGGPAPFKSYRDSNIDAFVSEGKIVFDRVVNSVKVLSAYDPATKVVTDFTGVKLIQEYDAYLNPNYIDYYQGSTMMKLLDTSGNVSWYKF